MSNTYRILGCLGLVLTGTAPVWGDGVDRNSLGGVSSGRGGTNIAHYDNGTVLLSNPAGIINVAGDGLFEYGIDGLATDLDYSDPENSRNADFQAVGLPQMSYIRKSADGKWAAGLGFYIPAGFAARWEMNAPFPIPGERGYKSIGALAKILPGVAYRPTDRLSLGATLGVGISHAELEGPFFLQSGRLAGTPALLDLQGTDVSPVWSVGAQYQLSERTMLGLRYTGESRFRLDGTARADVFGLNPLDPTMPVSSNFDAETDLVWPRSAGIGLTHWATDRQRVSADVLWHDWSHAFDRVDIKLSDASHPTFAAMGDLRDRFPLDWKDSVTVKLGYEYFTTCCDVWRFGYVFNSETIPNSTLTPYIPATLEHTFSAGYGKWWNNCRFDVAYQFAFGPEQNVNNSEIVGGDFTNSEMKSQAHWLFVSFTQWF